MNPILSHRGLAAALLCLIAVPGARAQTGHSTRPPKHTAAPRPPVDKPFPTNATFNLLEINGKPVSDPPSLKIDDTFRGVGYSGCNTFSAPLYQVRGMRLAMGPVALTHKTCEPARMTLERAYLTILHSGPSWDVIGSDLVIKGPTGTLRFRRGV